MCLHPVVSDVQIRRLPRIVYTRIEARDTLGARALQRRRFRPLHAPD